MKTEYKIDVFIEKQKEGLYFEVPFEVPNNISRIDISYSYKKMVPFIDENGNEYLEKKNVIDLALSDYNGEHVGSSGSDRDHIWISEYYSSTGYGLREIKKGRWNIIAGAYKVEEKGVLVTYEISLTHKELKFYKGDTHIHTLGSDGKLSIDEVVHHAINIGLDFIFITDHNNYANNIVPREEITVMPGVEWTHFKGHVNMLGLKKPYDGSFYANTLEEVKEKLHKAREKGAIVIINHPFDRFCDFKFGIDNVEYDVIEIWNNVIKESDMRALAWWRGKLNQGKRIPIIGGSDFHRYEIAGGIGIPCTCLYAGSRSPSDLYDAILKGHGYVSYIPNGPGVLLSYGEYINGDSINLADNIEVNIVFTDIKKGDVIKLTNDKKDEEINILHDYRELKLTKSVKDIKYLGVEIYRTILPGLPIFLCMVSNPLYFI